MVVVVVVVVVEFTLGYYRFQGKSSRRWPTSATAYAGYAPSSMEYITFLSTTLLELRRIIPSDSLPRLGPAAANRLR